MRRGVFRKKKYFIPIYRREVRRNEGTADPPPAAAIINQLQYGNLGADLYNGTLQ